MIPNQPKPQLHENGFIRLKDVLKLFPVSKSTWWLGIQQGRYPKPVKLSARITAWRVSDIKSLLVCMDRQNRLVARDSSCNSVVADRHTADNKNKNCE